MLARAPWSTLVLIALAGCLSAPAPLDPTGPVTHRTVGGLAVVPDIVAEGAVLTKLTDAAQLDWDGEVDTPAQPLPVAAPGLPIGVPVPLPVANPLAPVIHPVDHAFELPVGVTSISVQLDWPDASEVLSASILNDAGRSQCRGRAPDDKHPTTRVCTMFVVGEREKAVNWAIRISPSLGDGKASPEPYHLNLTLSVKPFALQGPALTAAERSPNLAFWTTAVSQDRHTGEPSLKVDDQGNVYIAAPSGRMQTLWKSTDQGATFTPIDIDGNAGPVGTVWDMEGRGGGDAEVYVTPDGKDVYFADLWGTCMTVAGSADSGASWWVNPLSCDLPGTDRQWLWALPGGNLWLTLNGASVQGGVQDALAPVTGTSPGGLLVLHSLDGGKTWLTKTSVPQDNCARGNIVATSAMDVFVAGCNADGPGVAASSDGGLTFRWVNVAQRTGGALDGFCFVCGIFTVIDADTSGNLYVVWADPSEDGKGFDIWMSLSQDKAGTWSTPVRVNTASTGNAVQPWIAAREPGHVAVAWYQTAQGGKPSEVTSEWYAHLAESTDAMEAAPRFEENVLSDVPVQFGPICLNGSGCTGARNLLDFLMVDIGPDGGSHIAFVDGSHGGSYASSNIMYARMTAGLVLSPGKVSG